MYINSECEHFDFGNTVPSEFGAYCTIKRCIIEEANCEYCSIRHEQKVKNELMYILEYAINTLEIESNYKDIDFPSGSTWTYDEVRKKLREYMK